MKRLDEIVPHKLSEILIAHGQASLTDARLCESLLKDYCGEYKEEISLLVLGVKERIAIDLLSSQAAVDRGVLRSLLTSRLRRHNSLPEGDARWVVDSWSVAVRALTRASVAVAPENASSAVTVDGRTPSATPRPRTFGIILQSRTAMRSVAFSPLNDSVASGADDGYLRLWDAQTGKVRVVEQCAGAVSCVSFSPNGVLLATINEEAPDASRVRLWDLGSNEPLDLGEVGSRLPSLAFSAGGTRLAAASAEPEGLIRVWNLQNGQTQTLRGAWGRPTSISFSPDGKMIAAADATLSHTAIRLWNLDNGAAEVLGHCRRQITTVAFSPNGVNVASGSWDETVRLWNVSTKRAKTLGADCSCVCCVAFSPEGDEVAACSLDGRIRVWNVETERSRIIGTCDNANDLAFSFDGEVLATASADGTIRLWNTRTSTNGPGLQRQ